MSDDADFYEDDEPAEKIRAAFDRGTKGHTAARSHGAAIEAPVDVSSLILEKLRFDGASLAVGDQSGVIISSR